MSFINGFLGGLADGINQKRELDAAQQKAAETRSSIDSILSKIQPATANPMSLPPVFTSGTPSYSDSANPQGQTMPSASPIMATVPQNGLLQNVPGGEQAQPDYMQIIQKLSPNSVSKLKGLNPNLVPKISQVMQILIDKGWNPVIASGLRTEDEQRKKVEQGYSSTMHSHHLTGSAIDIVDSRYMWNKEASNKDFQYWKDLQAAVESVGLESGGAWKIRDVAHVQLPKTQRGR